ncbi:MAG TPA: CAP domain-containing protein, partial [Gemmatimonadaceae bacterium]|nr:CAP domain-containing protein [Gemmatimonadaceae bacterium]
IAVGCASASQRAQKPEAVNAARFHAGRPAMFYGSDPDRQCPHTPVLEAMRRKLLENPPRKDEAAADVDPRLCAVAEALLSWNKADWPPRASVLHFLAWHFGMSTPFLHASWLHVESDDPGAIAGALIRAGTGHTNVPGYRFGFALDRSKNQPGVEILRVVRSMPFEVDPFPRQLALNGEATLSGELAWRRSSEETRIISDVTMEVCNSDGRFDSFSFPDGTSFRQRIRCSSHPGTMQIALYGEVQGRSWLSSFPVACGRELPTSVELPDRDVTAPGLPEQERHLFKLVNADRVSAGFAPLSWDEELAKTARELSARLSTHPFFLLGTHTSNDEWREERDWEDARDARLKAQHVLAQVGGNAWSVEDAHESVLADPERRCRLLGAAPTRAGVGVVVGPERGQPNVFFTELLRANDK